MKRRASFAVFALTVGTLIVVGALLYFLHGRQVLATVKALSQDAETAAEAEDYLTASDKYQLALGLKKDDPELLVQRAKCYSKAAESPEMRERAVNFLRKAIGTAPEEERPALTTELGEQYLQLGKFAAVTTEAVRLLNELPKLNELKKRKELKNASPEEIEKISALENAVAAGYRLLALSLVENFQAGALDRDQLPELSKECEETNIFQVIQRAMALNPTDEKLTIALARVYRLAPALVEAEEKGKTETDRIAAANDVVDRFVEKNGKNPKVLLARAQYRQQFGIAGSKEDARAAIKLDGDKRSTLRSAYFVLLPSGDKVKPADYQEALELGEKLLQDSSIPDPVVSSSVGATYYLAGNSQKAIETWKAGLEKTKFPPEQYRFLSYIADAQIADAYLNKEAIAQAKATTTEAGDALEKARSYYLRGEDFRQQLSNQRLRESYVDILEGGSTSPIAKLQELVNTEADAVDETTRLKAVALLADYYSKNGEFANAGELLDSAATKHRAPGMNARAGKAWLAANQLSKASRSFAAALDEAETNAATPETRIDLAATLLGIIARDRNRSLNDNQLSIEMDQLYQTLAALEKSQQIDSTLLWRIAGMRSEWKRIQVLRKKWSQKDDGLAELRLVEQLGENSPEALAFASINYQRHDKVAEADRVLTKLESLDATSEFRYRTELQLATLRNDVPRMLDVFGKMTNAVSPTERAQLAIDLSGHLRLTQIQPGQTGIDAARKIVVLELDRNPEVIGLWKLLVEIDVDRRDAKGIATTVEALTKTSLTDMSALCYARIFQALTNPKVTRKELDDALKDQKLFATLRPHSFETETLLGLIEHQLGNYAQQHGLFSEQRGHYLEAVRAYVRAIELGEPRLLVYERVNDLLPKLKSDEFEASYLPKNNFVLATSPRLTEIFATRKLQSGEAGAALEQAKQAIEFRPTDASAHVLYAQLLGAESRLIEAEQEFERALALEATSIKVWLEYFAFRMRYHRSEAGELLQRLEATTRVPATQKVESLARCYEALGNREKANEYYLQALKNSPKSLDLSLSYCRFQARFDAKASIERLRVMLAELPLEPAILRTLASVLFTQDEAGAAEAEELLLAGSLPDDDRAENRRTLIRLLSTRKDDKSVLKAIGVAQEVFAAYPHEVGDQLVLAALLESYAKHAIDPGTRAQRIAQAKEVWKKDISAENQDPSAKQRYAEKRAMDLARFAVRQGEADAAARLEEVEKVLNQGRKDDPGVIAEFMTLSASIRRKDDWQTWAKRLDEIDTNKVRSTALRAKFLVLEGDNQTAKELITQVLIAARGASKEQQRLNRIEMAGQIYTELGMHEEAVAWFKDLVKTDPSRYQLLATSLAKAGHVTEAVEFCKEIYGSKEDVAVLYAMTDLVSTYGKSADAIKTISALVREARKIEPRNPKLLESAAVLEFLTANHEESERLLREALAIAPNDVSILNNLACVLADKGIKLDEAITFVDKAIEIQSGEAPLLDTKGIVLLAKKQVDKALPLLELATSPPNKDPRHHLHLAVAYLKEKKYDECKEQLAKAKELGIDTLTLTPLDARYLEQVKSGKSNDS